MKKDELRDRFKNIVEYVTGGVRQEHKTKLDITAYDAPSGCDNFYQIKYKGLEIMYLNLDENYSYTFLEEWLQDMERNIENDKKTIIELNGKKYRLIDDEPEVNSDEIPF